MHQSISLIGYLGRDPEMRYTPAGQAVTSFSMATSRKYRSSDGEVMGETAWWRVTVWGKSAETCATYLQKGSMVYVEGRLMVDPKTGGPRMWTDQNGALRASFEVSATQIRFLSKKESSDEPANTGVMSEEDIPF
jgi:single-strand DNA-binding protein